MTSANIALIVYLVAQIFLILCYVPRITLWFKGYKKQDYLTNPHKNKIALLLPARNEGDIIENLLISIKNQTYPKNLFDVFVIVQNSSDKTIELTKEHLPNAFVQVVEHQTKKADALDSCIKTILNKNIKYDDYVIVDADNILTPTFLEQMNNALITGADIVIPRKRVKNWESSNKKNRSIWSNCSALTWQAVDTMGNKGKTLKNYSLALCGQGMLINGKIIEKLKGYPFNSLIEDYEISVECMRNNYKQFYYEHAELFAEEPITHKEYNKRRARWLKGFVQVSRKYNKEIKKLTFKNGKIKKENLYFLYGVTPVYVMFTLSILAFLAFLISGVVLLCNHNTNYSTLLLYSLIPLIVSYIQLFIHGIMCITQDKDINKMTTWEKIKVVICYPIIVSEYIWIFFLAFIKTDENWKPIERIKM